jgi:hypothetical protein
VTIVTDLALTGLAAQFGRGLVQDVTAQLLEKFASCLEQQLVTEPSAEAAAAADEEAFEPEPPPAISGLAIGAAAMSRWLERHKGLTSFLWASFFFVYLWLGMLAVGIANGTAFILSAVFGFASFLFIRICREDDPELRRLWIRGP